MLAFQFIMLINTTLVSIAFAFTSGSTSILNIASCEKNSKDFTSFVADNRNRNRAINKVENKPSTIMRISLNNNNDHSKDHHQNVISTSQLLNTIPLKKNSSIASFVIHNEGCCIGNILSVHYFQYCHFYLHSEVSVLQNNRNISNTDDSQNSISNDCILAFT